MSFHSSRAWLTVADLGATPTTLQRGENLTLDTGWSRHVADPAMYRDQLPWISDELAHLDQLTQDRVFFAALPPKLAGGDGSPVRAFAIEAGASDALEQMARTVASQPANFRLSDDTG